MDYNKVKDLIKLRSENKLTVKFHSKYGEILLREPVYKELVLLYSIRNGLKIEDEDFYIGFLLNLIVYPEEYELDDELLGVLWDSGEELFNDNVFTDEDKFEEKINKYEDFAIEVSNFYEDYLLHLKLYLNMSDREILNLSMEDFIIKVLLVKRKIKNMTDNTQETNDHNQMSQKGSLKNEYENSKNWKDILNRNKEMLLKINGGK